ncbi:sphingosine kinase 2-like [Phlebotomus argentipes]|uniref:sphingosine kinase 2-like n=1 Tax=Phlebotomus argentipes TaxID=94469 RepID=UPI0028935073|nr:sphingosine kinase 2-like [Phlebotomus argentipes]
MSIYTGDSIKLQDYTTVEHSASPVNEQLSEKGSERVFLAETFYITSKKNTVFQVRLSEKGLCLRKESSSGVKEQTILLADIIGCRCLRSKRRGHGGSACACSALPGPAQLKVVEANSGEQDESDASAYLYIYAYILKRSRRGGRRERTTITLRFRSFDKYDDNNREAQKWRTAIKALINDEVPKTPTYTPSDARKMLIILNPKSGSGKAREVFQQRVAPIFVEAELPFELHVTKRANYAREFVRTRDIFAFRGIVVVGGDGIYFEVINGMMERPDWERALEEVSVGVIPCGSGNGLARSIAHSYGEPYEPKPVLGASLTVIRGRSTTMDLVRVETKSQIMYSFLSIGWGLISDIDIESERLRAIGGQRFTLWSVHRLISLRTYQGRVSYLPASQVVTNGVEKQYDGGFGRNSGPMMRHSLSYNNALDCPDCHGEGDCETCDTGFGDVLSLETSTGLDSFRPRLDSWYSATSRKSAYYSTAESIYQSVHEKSSQEGSRGDDETQSHQMFGPASRIPALTTPVPDTWTTIEGEFVMVHAAYQNHLSTDCHFATSSKLNDGIIWLCIIRGGASRSQLLTFLLGLSSGTHIPSTQSEYIKMIPVQAFRIEPTSGGPPGCVTVDGEKVEYGPIQGEIYGDMANVMVPAQS